MKREKIKLVSLCAFFIMLLVMFTGAFNLPFKNDVIVANNARSRGANDDALNKIIADRLELNGKVAGYQGSWQEYLDQEYKNAENKFQWNMDTGVTPWSGVKASANGDPMIDPISIPKLNAEGFVEIYSGEQLVYAFEKATISPKIKLMNDIDLVGYLYDWYQFAPTNLKNVEIDGNNKIIYNIGSEGSFVKAMINSKMYNISFSNAKLADDKNELLGIVGNFLDGSGGITELTNIKVSDSIFFSAYPTYGGAILSYVAPFAEAKNITATNVGTSNNIVYAVKAHAGGAFGITKQSTIASSYSVDSTVIAGGNHSGGFISCTDGDLTASKSFTNNSVFGSKETGVFIGAIYPNHYGGEGNTVFEECFTSGTIEGQSQLGGFIGIMQSGDKEAISFKNCYTTSIVGMRKGGNDLGGFVGSIQSQSKPYTFENCFAAGEVGAIDTDVTATRSNSTTGGFIGSFNARNLPNDTFKNCYYDKQTTAMREWASGDTGSGNAGSRDYLDEQDKGINNIFGVRGVLTSDSAKFGAGLASQPISNYTGYPTDLPNVDSNLKVGFLGFTGDSSLGGSSIVTNSEWVYDGGNMDSSLHNCMYPQLKVFFDSDDVLVRAYSYASVATVHEQVWDKCTHGKSLERNTYDTVRDLTMRFTLTSYVENNNRNETVGIEWKKTNEKSNIYGDTPYIINTFEKITNSKYGRDYWTADKFAPGTEWMSVNFTVTGDDGQQATGTRRLRIIPTSNVEAGSDNLDITVGSVYNHAKDAFFAYSTAQRMATLSSDITTGVYPDEGFPFESSDKRSTIQQDSPLSSGTKIADLFAVYNDKVQVSGEYLTDVENGINEAHKANIINTYVYDVKKFEALTGKDLVEIIYVEDGKTKDESAIISPKLIENGNVDAIQWLEKFNGKKAFAENDNGRYLIEYEWIRPDGRYMRDAKMVMVQPKEHMVDIEVKNYADNSANKNSLKLSAVKYDGGNIRPATDFGANTASNLQKKVEHFKAVDLAFKNVNQGAQIKKIKFEITTKDLNSDIQKQTVVVDNVLLDAEFNVPITYYYSSYEEGGKYYAKKVTTDRKYVLKYDAVDEYYYLTMNNKFVDKETGLIRSDLESDVKIIIYVDDAVAMNSGDVSITNKTFENGIETNTMDQITYTIKDKDGNVVEIFTLNSSNNNQKTMTGLEIGSYTIERAPSTLYKLQNITIDKNTPVNSSVTNFNIMKGGNTKIVVNNEKNSTSNPDDTGDKPKDDNVTTGDETKFKGLLLFATFDLFLICFIIYLKRKMVKD